MQSTFPRQVLAATTLLSLASLTAAALAEDDRDFRWRETDSSIALMQGDDEQIVWKFNYGKEFPKPYFHPVSVGGRTLTWDQPPDHVWHHGIWFSWKYINGVNYWEPNAKTGKPDGKTKCSEIEIETTDDFAATITMELHYAPAGSDESVLAERRAVTLAPPSKDGELTFDWKSQFTALTKLTLDRTPAGDKPWGGYAGLSVRFSKELTDRQATCTEGELEFDAGNRNRSHSNATDYSGLLDGKPLGLAFFDATTNPRHPTKWYVIRSPVMSYVNAALLHDEPLQLEYDDELTLRYRLIAHPGRWDSRRLQHEYARYVEAAE